MKTHRLLFAFCLLGVCLLILTAFFLTHSQMFPMNGFSGPAEWRENTFAGIRFTGDSWRYIDGGLHAFSDRCFDSTQRSYLGYCHLTGLSLYLTGKLLPLILCQTLIALGGLGAVMATARRLGGDLAAVVAGALFALNPEFAAWHTAVMTESLYTSAVAVMVWLAVVGTESHRLTRLPLVVATALVCAFIRPTGWILMLALPLFLVIAILPTRRRQIIGVLVVLAVFLLTAATSFTNGINSQSPTSKLYQGEVVWQEPLWKVDMPPADLTQTSLSAGLCYALRHPLASGWLVCKRLGVMILRIRPSYSTAHNAFLLMFQLPLALLGITGLFLRRRHPAALACAVFAAAHALVVALTFNDNDGRFTLYIMPLLGIGVGVTVAQVFQCMAARRSATPPAVPAPESSVAP